MDGTEVYLETVLAPNPSVFTGRGTNSYVLGRDGDVIVIDPGPADAGHLAALDAAVKARGRLSAVVLTHHHADHAESAAEFARRAGAPLAAIPHPRSPKLDRRLADGDDLAFAGGTLRVVHTPGHCRDHACLLWAEAGLLFAGDLVAGEGYIVIDPPDGSMRDYLASLERVRDLDLRSLRPGHGPGIDSPRQYLDGYLAHRLEREAKVVAALGDGSAVALSKILERAYDDTPVAMHPVAARSLWAHLEKLVQDGVAVQETRGAEGADAKFRLRA